MKKESTARLDHLRNIETTLQKKWRENRTFEVNHVPQWSSKMTLEEKNKSKFFCTFPYAYMNGRLHLGHAFSLSKAEFMSRYQRMQGKNALFPIGYHCTGMPISAAAIKIQRELANPDIEQKQTKILLDVGVPEEEVSKFADPKHWVDYFPPKGQEDLQTLGLGVDYRRSFITTDMMPHYNKFVEWHFLKLKQADAIRFGKRNSVYCMEDKQPCADHDRAEGENAGITDYTLVKMKVVANIPEQLKALTEKSSVYMLAATLRPETMYGQTNCFVLPNANYNVYETVAGEFVVCSEHSAKNMACQEILKESFVVPNFVERIMGSDLIGVGLEAPLSVHKLIYVLPMLTISMTKGTGVVTSVPSDSPDDFFALKELKENKEMQKKYNITEEMLLPELIEIIEVPEFGSAIARKLVEEAQFTKQNKVEKLAELKDIAYSKGFYEGTMIIGDYKGLKVKEAKDKIKEHLISEGHGFAYSEPEKRVVSRSGHVCVVAPLDQWYISYGEENYKKLLLNFVQTDFETYSANTKKVIY